MSLVLLDPELDDIGAGEGAWMVVIYNNDHTNMDDVMQILMRATHCDEEEAFIEMWEAHTFGKAPVHFAGREECDQAAAIIASIGVRAEVMKEWND
ncbi:MAG: ATP-dependent Clp protease adaptor ClpS [Fimbriimonas sp.]